MSIQANNASYLCHSPLPILKATTDTVPYHLLKQINAYYLNRLFLNRIFLHITLEGKIFARVSCMAVFLLFCEVVVVCVC